MTDVIVIPTYNERENIQRLIPEIFAVVPDVRIVVVDDSSPDGTAEAVQELMEQYSQLELMSRTVKDGLGSAYKHALSSIREQDNVRGIITMDADGSHGAQFLPALRAGLDTHDLVIGSRYVPGGSLEDWALWRRLLSIGGNWYARILVGGGIADLTAGFVAMRSTLARAVDFNALGSAGYAYQMEFKNHCVRRCSASVTEVPIAFGERREGESKLSNQIIWEGIRTPLRLWWQRVWKG